MRTALLPKLTRTPYALTSKRELYRTRPGIQYLKNTGKYEQWRDSSAKQFVAWDGEGWTDANLEHRYMLLQCSTGARIHREQLATVDCLDLILREGGSHPGAIHIIYGGGYDATHILRDLPTELQLQLKDDNEVRWSVPYIPGKQERNIYTINYLPHKWLTIKGYSWTHKRWIKVKIYDLLTFFQSSFIKALDSRNIPIDDRIRSGKAGRSDFIYEDIEEISQYCQLELESLVALANTLREEFNDADVSVTSWHGPGAVANANFKRYKVIDHMGEIPAPVQRASQFAYFGGHFEQYKCGHYNGPVFLYDINSAYPHQLRNLPTFTGMEFELVDGSEFHGQLGVWLCDYRDPSTVLSLDPQPLPWRGKGGTVGFPTQTKGWYWTSEVIAAGITPISGYQFISSRADRPFSYIADMYETRKRWKEENRGGEKALKLCMNSAYGKLAQRVGKNGEMPRYHNLSWAGMITSGTRAQLWQAVQQKPWAVIAVETDSIMTTEPLDLDVGDNLGQWGLTLHQDVTYIQSGIYFTDDGIGKTKARTRGIDVKQISEPLALEWLKDPSQPLLTMAKIFIGLGNPRTDHLYGQWQDFTKEVRVAGSKRVHLPHNCTACAAGANMAEALHDLTANPFYGLTPSEPHTLPWIDKQQTQSEMSYVGDAVAEFERRHVI